MFNGLKKSLKNEIFLNCFETLAVELRMDIEIIFMKYNHSIKNYEPKEVKYSKILENGIFKYQIQFPEEGNYKIHKFKIKYKNSWFYQIIDLTVHIERNRKFVYLETDCPKTSYCFEEINIKCKIITNFTEELYLDLNGQKINIFKENKERNSSYEDKITIYSVGLRCKYLDLGEHLLKLGVKDFFSQEILIRVVSSVILKPVFLKFLTDFFFILVKNISDKKIELNNLQIINPNYTIENIYLVNIKIDCTNFEEYFTEYFENKFSQNLINNLLTNDSVHSIFENNTFDEFFYKNILNNIILEQIENKFMYCLNPNEEYIFCVKAKFFQCVKINETLEKNLSFLFKDIQPETYEYKNSCTGLLEHQIDLQKFIDLKNIFLKNYFNSINIPKFFLDFFPLFIDREIPICINFNENISVENFKECFYKFFLAIDTDKMKNSKFLFHESIMEYEKLKSFFMEKQEEACAFYMIFSNELYKNRKSEIFFAFFNFLPFKNMKVQISYTKNILLSCENTPFIVSKNSFTIKKYEIIPLVSGNIPISDLFIIYFGDKQLSKHKKYLLIKV
ncbi:hypothetical protein LUQ84_3513 [Hamiltosporidium tvaerminnensis]|nr:hypothetical protein LUQ84_3513 [Hamiltosporidium tvaerminnensis]